MRERLYRSRKDRMIGGLAAGMARNLGIDVTWARLGWLVFATLTQGLGILVYVALLFIVPEEPEQPESSEGAAPAQPSESSEPSGSSGFAWTPPRTADVQSSPRSQLEQLVSGSDSSRNTALVIGLVLVGAGAWLLLRRFVAIDLDVIWPIVAVGLGVVLVLAALRTGGRSR